MLIPLERGRNYWTYFIERYLNRNTITFRLTCFTLYKLKYTTWNPFSSPSGQEWFILSWEGCSKQLKALTYIFLRKYYCGFNGRAGAFLCNGYSEFILKIYLNKSDPATHTAQCYY
jgi:hypothetical protein